jgi:hypothetical protein
MRGMDVRARLTAAAAGVALAYLVVLGLFLVQGAWVWDAAGRPLVVDFLPVHVGGQLALHGQAALAYDWRAFHGVQAAFVGHPFAGFLGWHYPPLFFAVAMALAILPYGPAFLTWVTLTGAAYATAIAAIAGRRAVVFALALPPVLACALVGQNGFFTAALLGAMLLCLPTRPVMAGLLLAVLTFKPQFGILIPFALLAGGYWRALAVAAAASLAWIGVGYGLAPAAFTGFLHYLPETGGAVLRDGAAGWFKLQSVYAATRLLGGGDVAGWIAQGAMVLVAGGFTIRTWRGPAPFARKAATLVCAALLATPYVYFYDLPILAVPLAFLWREKPFDRFETSVIAAAALLLAGCATIPAPLGLGAILLTAALAMRRSCAA